MNVEPSELERIKAKIAKILNLAEKATNENEAAAAMSAARNLMDKYELDQIDILMVEGVQTEFMAGTASRAYAALPKFMSILATSVAIFNDCQAVLTSEIVNYKKKPGDAKKWGSVIMFRGMKSDVEMAIDMFARLIGAINNICRIYLEEGEWDGKYPVGIGSKFKMGAASAICAKLEDMTIERNKITSTGGTGLVLYKTTQVTEYFGKVEYKTSHFKLNPNDYAANDAYRQGKIRGRNVEINKSIKE